MFLLFLFHFHSNMFHAIIVDDEIFFLSEP